MRGNVSMLRDLDHHWAFRTEVNVVTLTQFPFALMRKVPGHISLISIPPEGLARSVHPERHVCPVLWFPGSGTVGGAVGRAVLSRAALSG